MTGVVLVSLGLLGLIGGGMALLNSCSTVNQDFTTINWTTSNSVPLLPLPDIDVVSPDVNTSNSSSYVSNDTSFLLDDKLALRKNEKEKTKEIAVNSPLPSGEQKKNDDNDNQDEVKGGFLSRIFKGLLAFLGWLLDKVRKWLWLVLLLAGGLIYYLYKRNKKGGNRAKKNR